VSPAPAQEDQEHQETEELEEREEMSALEPWRLGLLAGAVTGAVGAAIVGWTGHLLVVAGHLLPWTVLVAACLVGGALLGSGGRWLRLAVALLGLAVLGSGMLWTGLHSLHDVTLSPGGAEDCHVVVKESSQLRGYTGDVYVRHGQWGVANRVATYIAPDPLRAADFGSYELSWRGLDGRLSIGYQMGAGDRSALFRCG
jgi:hypothetical protein